MTKAPGASVYMPLEDKSEQDEEEGGKTSRYDTSIDVFSFGTLHIKFYALRNNIIIIAWGYLLLFTRVYVVLSEVCYVCTPTFMLHLLIWGIFIHFEEKLPEAICCLQTCNVEVVLLVMYCMYIQAFIVNISQLWVYLCYLLLYCLRLFVVVYKLVMLMLCCWVCIACIYKPLLSLVLI